MEYFRFAVNFRNQIGFLIEWNYWSICIEIPFIQIFIGIGKDCKGVNIFGSGEKNYD